MSTVTRRMLLVFAAVSVVAVLSAACGGEPEEPPTPGAAARPADPAPTQARTASTAQTAPTPRPADTPLPAQPAAEPSPPVAPAATPTAAAVRVQPRPNPTAPVLDLHHSQVVTAPGPGRAPMAPWRDDGKNRLYSTHVFGTPFILNEKGEAQPWIAVGITPNEDFTVWTMKLREDAVFQDGTPIKAADFKAYWEYGARPEDSVSWGGAGLTFGRSEGLYLWEGVRPGIRGWKDLKAGDVLEAEGLRVIDDHTLEIKLSGPIPAWPLYMAAWHVGISKLGQIESDENWRNAPIGAGPFSLTYDPGTGLTELTRVDLVGWHWNGPHDTPIIEKLVLPNIEDAQARLVMFENGELDLMSIDRETYEMALDPRHPYNPLLYESPYAGLWYIEPQTDMPPLEDFHVRKALAHGQDMEGIVRAVWGPTATHAKGLISSRMPCHYPDANYQPYDPDLARQYLSESPYEKASNLPPLLIDLHRSDMVAMGVAVKEYWKDNLSVELDILKRESGMPRRDWAHFYRLSRIAWMPDPSRIVDQFASDPHWRPYWSPDRGYPVIDALAEHALTLPLDDPYRCEAFRAFEEEYLYKVYTIPIREADPVRWLVQPWLSGFESTFNVDFNTLTTAYVARH